MVRRERRTWNPLPFARARTVGGSRASDYIRVPMLDPSKHLDALNPGQRAAAEYGTAGLPHELPGPLLIIAGAGTGKTTTLAHRVAHLVMRGADPRRTMLLTFTRRAAETMTRRAEQIAAQVANGSAGPTRVAWSGTFHAIANRLLRKHAQAVGLA